MQGFVNVLLREANGPVVWKERLPLAGMKVDEARGAVNVLGRLQVAGDDGVAALAGLGLVPDVIAYREGVFAAIQSVPVPKPALPADSTLPCFVTLLQMAAIVQRSKRTLEKAKDLPFPDVEGGGGMAGYWEWEKIRPWLEDRYGMMLPKRFPADRIPPRPPRSSRHVDDEDESSPVRLGEPDWEPCHAQCTNPDCPRPGRWTQRRDTTSGLCPICFRNR